MYLVVFTIRLGLVVLVLGSGTSGSASDASSSVRTGVGASVAGDASSSVRTSVASDASSSVR
jgi:hypothetical protein